MEFHLPLALPMLERTPAVLRTLLADLPSEWTDANEGPESWSAFDVVGHLIHGERTDWIPRARMILEEGRSRPFEPFDRFAQSRDSAGRSLDELLGEFEQLRAESVRTLEGWRLTDEQLALQGEHPAFGAVTLRQLLATWTAHDLSHIAQIARVLTKQYRDAVGPWRAYLPIMDR
jgi:hypothetical protein